MALGTPSLTGKIAPPPMMNSSNWIRPPPDPLVFFSAFWYKPERTGMIPVYYSLLFFWVLTSFCCSFVAKTLFFPPRFFSAHTILSFLARSPQRTFTHVRIVWCHRTGLSDPRMRFPIRPVSGVEHLWDPVSVLNRRGPRWKPVCVRSQTGRIVRHPFAENLMPAPMFAPAHARPFEPSDLYPYCPAVRSRRQGHCPRPAYALL